MGVLYRGTKDEARAIAFGQQAVNGWTALACLEPDNERYQAELARSWNGLGATFAEFKKYEAAQEPLDTALSIRRMLVDAHPDTETTLRDLAVTYAECRVGSGESRRFPWRRGSVQKSARHCRAVVQAKFRSHAVSR